MKNAIITNQLSKEELLEQFIILTKAHEKIQADYSVTQEEHTSILKFNSELKSQNDEFQTQTAELKNQIAQLQKNNELLTEALRLAKARHFGNKSEKLEDVQYSLFDEAALPENTEEIEEEDELLHIPSHTRQKKRGRKGLPKDWPRVEKIYDLAEAEKQCGCGCELTCIGEERTEQVELIPASKYVIVHVQKKYACKGCEETIKQAPKPAQPIPKSIAGPKLLASVLTSKYQFHLPLYRQEQLFKQMGLELARYTLSVWVIRCAELLIPLEKLLEDRILSYDIAYSDESRLQVLQESGREAQQLSWMWLFGGGTPEQFSFIYRYDISRGHDVPLKFFEDYGGYLHCDGWGSYDTLAAKNKHIKLSGCLYHVRRKFMDAYKLNTKKKSGVAYQVLKIIQKIAKWEEHLQGLPPPDIQKQRLDKEKPLLEKLHALLLEKLPTTPPKSTLGKAMSYALNQWDKLLVYLEDGRLENNNNRTERGVKPFAKGRDNWMFCNSVDGAIASARIYSFIETCKYHDIEPYYWFAYVLEKLPSCNTLEELEALLPFNIDKSLLDPKNFIPEF